MFKENLKMKNTILLVAIGSLMACNASQKMVGNDQDKHGCKGSAGQTWSVLKNNCIQVFNEGTRLNPIETKEGEAIISAFVLMNDDKSKAELFLGNEANIILEKNSEGNFASKKYVYKPSEATLYVDGHVLYQKD